MMRRENKLTHCYIGQKPVCGCIVAVASYHYEMRARTAKAVADMIKDGLLVCAITWEGYRAMGVGLVECSHGKVVAGETLQPELDFEGAREAVSSGDWGDVPSMDFPAEFEVQAQ